MRATGRRTLTRLGALALLAGAAAVAVDARAAGGTPSARTVSRASSPGHPWLVTRTLPLALSARAALDEVFPEARGRDLSVLDDGPVRGGGRITRFVERLRGVPVLGRGASLRRGPSGEVTGVSDLEPVPPADLRTRPSVGADVAAEVSRRYGGLAADEKSAHLALLPLHGRLRLVWAVAPPPSPAALRAPVAYVDAHTGRILLLRETLRRGARANVYPTNPVTTPGLALSPFPIGPAAGPTGTLTSDVLEARSCVDNRRVVKLSSTPVHVCDLVQVARANGSGDFEDAPLDDGSASSQSDAFSEVSVFFHVGRAYQFFRGLAGDDALQVVKGKPLQCVANLRLARGVMDGDFSRAGDPQAALVPLGNAFFAPAGDLIARFHEVPGGGLWFGQGERRDFGYDGDVVYHEFTHAVVDATLGLEHLQLDRYGLFDAPSAMNEGISDYFAAALSGDSRIGEYAVKDFGDVPFIRDLENSDTCPEAITGEPHYDSTLFSGGLFAARASLPEADRPRFDAAIYEAMRMSGGRGDLGFEDAVALFSATLATKLPAGDVALRDEMRRRGVLPGCTRILEVRQGRPTRAPDGPSAVGAFTAWGKYVVGDVATVPGMIQLSYAIPTKAGKLAVRFAERPPLERPLVRGTPFAPVVLAKFGAPITWRSDGGQLLHDADVVVRTPSGDAFVVPVKEGAERVYLQIGNEGELDGGYDAVTVDVAAEAAPPRSRGDAGADAAGGAGLTPDTWVAGGGCACEAARGTARAGGAAVLGVLLAAALAQRRRRSRRA